MFPVGVSVPGASQWATCDQSGECEAETDKRWVGSRAGARQPRTDSDSGAAESAAGRVHTTLWREGNVSDGRIISII